MIGETVYSIVDLGAERATWIRHFTPNDCQPTQLESRCWSMVLQKTISHNTIMVDNRLR